MSLRSHSIDLDRDKSIKRLCPDLYDYESCLYVGARPDRYDYAKGFKEITIIEAYKPNVDWLKPQKWIHEIIHLDIRNFNFWDRDYDVVMWWHGPEHLEEQETLSVIKELEKVATKMVVLGCPWGNVPQDDIYGNIFERHLSALSPEFFMRMGYRVETLGKPNTLGSNILAVKRI